MVRNNFLAFLILSLVISAGCKKDEETDVLVGSFMLKGEKFEIYSEGDAATASIQLFHDQADGITSGSVTIAGVNSSNAGSVQFGIEYTTSKGITGTYKDEDIPTENHVFDSFLCNYSISPIGSSNLISGNYGNGTLTVTMNSSDNFTVNFDFMYSDSTEASGNITQRYTVQEIYL